MARKARYTKALPVYVTPEVRARLDQIAEEYEVSLAEATRVLINAGLVAMTPEKLGDMFL